MGWDDVKDYQLPQVQANAQGAFALSESMLKIVNHMIEISQYEPEFKEKVDKLKNEIEQMQREKDLAFEYDLTVDFNKIPETHKKNQTLQTGWIRVLHEKKYQEYEDNLIEMKVKLISVSREYNEIERRLKAIYRILDVGRSILSSLKEELRNV